MEEQERSTLFDMQLDQLAQSRLTTLSGWGMFVSITILSCTALFAIGLALGSNVIASGVGETLGLSTAESGLVLILLFVVAGLVAVWFFFLLRASLLIRQGVREMNSDKVADGMRALRVYFNISIALSVLSLISTIRTLLL